MNHSLPAAASSRRKPSSLIRRIFPRLPSNPARDRRILKIDPEHAYFNLEWQRDYWEHDYASNRYSVASAAKTIGIAQSDVREFITAEALQLLPIEGGERQPRINADSIAAFLRHLWLHLKPGVTEQDIERRIEESRRFKEELKKHH